MRKCLMQPLHPVVVYKYRNYQARAEHWSRTRGKSPPNPVNNASKVWEEGRDLLYLHFSGVVLEVPHLFTGLRG